MKLFDRSRFVHQFFTGTEISKLAILVSTALLTLAMDEGFTTHPRSTFMLLALLGVATSIYFIARRWEEIKPAKRNATQSLEARIDIAGTSVTGEKIIINNVFLIYFTVIVCAIYGMRDGFSWMYLLAFITVIYYTLITPFIALKKEHPGAILIIMLIAPSLLLFFI